MAVATPNRSLTPNSKAQTGRVGCLPNVPNHNAAQLRVLVVSPYIMPHCGGMEVLVDQEVQSLARAGHAVVLVGSNASNVGREEGPTYGPTVKVVKVPAWNGLEQPYQIPWVLFSPKLIPVLWRYVQWCDVVHVHGFLSLASLVALVFSWLMNKPSTLTEHIGVAWYSSLFKRMIQWSAIYSIGAICVRLANRCFAHHDRIVALLRQMAGPNSVVKYFPNPLLSGFLRPPTELERRRARESLGWTPDRPKVLFVGRLVVRKGIDLLLSAKNEEFDLIFCGPGNPLILGNYRNNGITYFPACARHELIRLYHAADLLAVPSRSEGGLVLVAQEALLCGLPVLLGDDSGLARYRNCVGLHFCALNPLAILQGIRKILAKQSHTREDFPPNVSFETFLPNETEWVKGLLDEFQRESQRQQFSCSTRRLTKGQSKTTSACFE
jgi:D-inositol-3-phosphate glycosyltransferase